MTNALRFFMLVLLFLTLVSGCAFPTRLTPAAVTPSPALPTPLPPSPTPTPLGGSGQIVYVFQEGDQKGIALLNLHTGAKRQIIAPKTLYALVVYPLKVAGKVYVFENEQKGKHDGQTYILDARDGTEVFRDAYFFLASADHRWVIDVLPGGTDLALISLTDGRRVILTRDFSSGKGHVSHNGQRLVAYGRTKDQTWQGLTARGDGTEVQILEQSDRPVNWGIISPDGQMIALLLDFKTIRIYWIDSGESKDITTEAQSPPVFTPDGRSVIFAQSDGVYAYHVDTGVKNRIYTREDQEDPTWLWYSWSTPDSRLNTIQVHDQWVFLQPYWSDTSGNHSEHLILVDLAGENTRVLLRNRRSIHVDYIEATGDCIIRAEDDSGNKIQYRLGKDGRSFCPLRKGMIIAGERSPDGKKVLYSHAGTNQLCIANPDGTDVVLLNAYGTVAHWVPAEWENGE